MRAEMEIGRESCTKTKERKTERSWKDKDGRRQRKRQKKGKRLTEK